MRETRAVRPAFPIHYLDQGGSVNEDSIPYGFCHCGCGQRTTVSPRTSTAAGWVRGEPRFFKKGHHIRLIKRLEWSSELWQVEDRGYETACWIWQQSIDRHGYAIYGSALRIQSSRFAHRESYTRHIGPITPPELTIDHLCRQHACVNPSHLEPVPHKTNVRRGDTAKLTAEDAQTIKDLKAAGVYYKDIAARFGVHHSTVYWICSGRGWR